MRHATTNYRAIMARIDTGDKSVRTACYQAWDGGFAYYIFNGRDRITVSIDKQSKTVRPLAVSFDGYEVAIYKSQYVYNQKRVTEADEMLHDWLYPREVKNNGRIEGFKSLLPYM